MLVATILASSMVFIDGSVVNIALPVLQLDLNATAGQVQWVIQAYSLFLSALILVGGSLGDHFGRRRMFVTGLVVFAAASALCGFARDVNQLIAARAVQGMASALLTPGSLSILTVTFGAEERGKAIGTWSSFSAITAALGPPLGGWIVQHASWRWIFFINLPLAVAVLALALRCIPESHDDEAVHHIDWLGAALATVGLGAVVYAFIGAAALGWQAPILTTLAAGVISLVLFVVAEMREAFPMVPPRLFRSRTFSVVNLLTLLLYAALGTLLYFLPFDLILVQHYSPSAAGLVFLPFIALMVVMSPWAGSLVHKSGPKLPLVAGPLIVALAFVGLALIGVGGSYWTTFFPCVLFLGFGMGLTVAPLTTTVMGSVDADHVGVASGVNNAVSRTGGLLAVAMLSVLVTVVFAHSLDRRVAAITSSPTVAAAMHAQNDRLAAARPPTNEPPAVRRRLERAVQAAYVDAFRAVMLSAAALAFAGSLSAFAFLTTRR